MIVALVIAALACAPLTLDHEPKPAPGAAPGCGCARWVCPKEGEGPCVCESKFCPLPRRAK